MRFLRDSDVKRHLAPSSHPLTMAPSEEESKMAVAATEVPEKEAVIVGAPAPLVVVANGSAKADRN
jgi:hypothetical protein